MLAQRALRREEITFLELARDDQLDEFDDDRYSEPGCREPLGNQAHSSIQIATHRYDLTRVKAGRGGGRARLCQFAGVSKPKCYLASKNS
jgi:hypothetical protein